MKSHDRNRRRDEPARDLVREPLDRCTGALRFRNHLHDSSERRLASDLLGAKAKGVKRVCIPNRSTKSPERKREQKKRWFRDGQKWRTGCEGRISVVKRRHGLDRCRYKGFVGMDRWVGLGVIADNVVNIGRAMEKQTAP